jgi:class 3 adenylate cyclase
MANMAIEMLDFVSKHPALVRRSLGIHIGIATGPVVAGVIGTKRFIYDLWGDTVNIASRLTDDAKEGQILTDKLTFNRLRLDFLFEPPNVLNVKGKGEMTSYRMIGRASRASDSGTNGNVFHLPASGSAPASA